MKRNKQSTEAMSNQWIVSDTAQGKQRLPLVMKIKRLCAGYYEASVGEYVVTINHRADLNGWMAVCGWDRFLYTDAVPTYKQAKKEALCMFQSLADWQAGQSNSLVNIAMTRKRMTPERLAEFELIVTESERWHETRCLHYSLSDEQMSELLTELKAERARSDQMTQYKPHTNQER